MRREFRIKVHFPIECEYFELYESEAAALGDAIDFAIEDARELAGTRGIKTWENLWNLYIDKILDMSIEDGKSFIDAKYEDYLRDLIYVEATPVENTAE